MNRSLVSLIFLLGACNVGTRPDTLRLAQSARGASVAVRVRNEPRDRLGELFAVDSIGIVIRSGTLMRIHWSAVAVMDVDQLGQPYDIARGEMMTAEKRFRLALVSRFPQGLGGPLLDTVLQRMGQGAIEEIR